MVTILHTADWHIGQTLAGFARDTEHALALARVVAIARERAVDAVIVAGDVFDSANPSAEALRSFYDTLAALRAARPAAAIVIVAGNHDAAARLEAPRALFDTLGVRVVGTIARRDGALDLGAHLVPVGDAAGAVAAHVLAIPYPRFADLPVVTVEGGAEEMIAGVRALYAEAVAASRARIGDAPLIATGHLHVAGALESEGAERRILLGGEHAVPADAFPADLAYVALGHLHRPQDVGRPSLRYAGSLFPLSKTEIGYRHGVAIVSIAAGAVTVEHVSLPRPVAHLMVPERGALPLDALPGALDALALDPALPRSEWPFLHLVIALDGPAPGLRAEIDRLVEHRPLRLVSVAVERPAADRGPGPAAPDRRLAEHAPEDLFARAFEQVHGSAPEDAHRRVFAQIAAEV